MIRAGLARRRRRCFRVSAGSSCASTASFTWHIVHSGFFPPERKVGLGEEKEAYCRQNEMTFEREVVADLEMVQADFPLVVLEAALDVPTGKSDVEDGLERNARRSIGNEILGISARDGDRDDEPMKRAWHAFDDRIERDRSDVPDLRSLVGVLDVVGTLGTHVDLRGQFFDGPGGMSPIGEAGKMARAAEVIALLGIHDSRELRPTEETLGDFTDVAVATGNHAREKRGLASVAFVEAEPAERNAMSCCSIDEFQSDLRLGPEGHALRDLGGPAATRILRPTLGEIQFPVQQRMETGVGEAEVDRDGAIVRLAGRPAILPLDAGSLGALLDERRLVDDPDGVAPAVGGGDLSLELLPHQILIPHEVGEKMLEGSGMNVGFKRDRLDRLAREISQLPADVGRDVPTGGHHGTIFEDRKSTIQRGTKCQQILGLHVFPLSSAFPRDLSALGAEELE